jgi:serine/threonine protein kinase
MSAPVSFGPYELVRRLGSGGMAETFLAVRRGPGGFEQHVCVKRILPALESDPELVRLFMEEARLAAQLRHANITQVVDFGTVDGSHYLTLELVDGIDLRALLAQLRTEGRALDPSVAIYIATELAAALEFAHTPEHGRHAVIHRDISPSNILLSRSGEVYLTDFGIARAMGAKRRTQSGVVRGKVPYMAAEYAMTGTFDQRSDLFAVGVVLFEALAGRRPFDGVTELDTLTRIKEGTHDSLSALCPAAPDSLCAIVEQLLVPRADERFQAAAALLHALAHVAPPPTVSRQLAELVRTSIPSIRESLDPMPSRTAPMTGGSAAPVYPQVTPAGSGAETRTNPPPKLAAPRITLDEQPWATTDPEQISHHDRPSPYYTPPSPPISIVPASTPVPITRIRPPEPKRRGWLWIAIVVFGATAFAAAVGGAYFIVDLLRHSPP